MEIRAQIIQSFTDLKKYSDLWTNLYQAGAYDIFQSFDWFESCCKYISQDNELFSILCFEQDNLIAIAPFHIITTPNGKILTFMGGALTDYNTILLKNGYSFNPVWKVIIEVMSLYLKVKYNSIWINHINAFSQELEQSFISSPHLNVLLKEQEIAMAIDLPKNEMEFKQMIKPNVLKKILYYSRRLSKVPQIEFGSIKKGSCLESYISWFMHHKKNLWEKFNIDIPNEMKGESYFSFLKTIIEKSLLRGEVIIPSIIHNNKIIASGIYFDRNKSLIKYIQSWDYDYKSYNVGTILDWYMIHHALGCKYKTFDLGRGGEEYKHKLGAREIVLTNFSLCS
ncbi:MAG: GNAT family N-acetyltransferase [Alphaproteobacteria bacterium]|nr:GNAT family N-acetyltransferase [Alphaproteobacteria bacterium]MBY0501893.1 GNAT family N-acetyltransferase [Alphaproteobacteria bacterium]